MAVEANTVQYAYLGDGTTKIFSFPSKFLANSDIVVGVNGVQQMSGYTVAGAGNDSGGTVTFTVAPVLGAIVVLLRDPPISQLTSFEDGSATLGGTLENVADRLTAICQILRLRVDKAIRASDLTPGEVPAFALPLVEGNVLYVGPDNTVIGGPYAYFGIDERTKLTALPDAAALALLLAAKANLASPTFTGSAPAYVTTAPTPDQFGRLNVGWYSGFDGSGTSDMSAKMQLALDRLRTWSDANNGQGGKLVLPSGVKVLVSTGLTYTRDGPLAIEGDGGREQVIIRQACPTLFTFASDNPSAPVASQQDLALRNFRCTTETTNSTLFDIQNPRSVEVQNITGSPANGWWANVFKCLNVRTSSFRKVFFRGDHGLGTKADVRGYLFNWLTTNGAGAFDVMYDDILAIGFDRYWIGETSGTPSLEGHLMSKVRTVTCNHGIRWKNTASGYVPPQMTFLNGHMNNYQTWGHFEGVAQIDIAHSTFELNSVLGDTDLVALRVIDSPNFGFADSAVNFTGGSRAAYVVSLEGIKTRLATIHDIRGATPGAVAGFVFGANTTYNNARDCTFIGATAAFGDNGSNNTATNIRSPAS